MPHPTHSDAFDARGLGLRTGQVRDPRTVEEKKRVWTHIAELKALGYPADYDPSKGRAWTKDECMQVKSGALVAQGIQRTKLDGSPIHHTPETMDIVSVYAGLKNAGIRPPPGSTEAQVRALYAQTLEDLKNPRVVEPPVLTQPERAHFAKPPAIAEVLPMEKWPRGRLLKHAKQLGLKTAPSMKSAQLIEMIRGADGSADGQPSPA